MASPLLPRWSRWILRALSAAFPACASAPLATFETPEAAMREMGELAGSSDDARKAEVFGADWREFLHSGDADADREDAARVREMIAERLAFEDRGEEGRIALLGDEEWPFPFPLVEADGGWTFDVEAGREELHNRRIGRNELSTIATLHAYVDAQREYFGEGRDGNPPAFAQTFRSDEGRRNGLYWPAAEGESESPLGALAAEAAAEGYRFREAEATPYHGYHYRILTGQGKHAPGGERSYLDAQGRMTGGFAAIAWPATHGNSGIMTFLVNHQGIVFEKDLGSRTDALARRVKAYDPDASWAPTPD